MTGRCLMNRLMDPAARDATMHDHTYTEAPAAVAAVEEAQARVTDVRSRKVRADIPIPAAPYLDRKVRDVPHLAEIWSYINPHMLYGKHLGYKGNFEKNLPEHEPKTLDLFHKLEEVKHEAMQFMRVRVVWQFFEAERDGNAIHLFAPSEATPMHTFRFGRQSSREDGLCLSDYILDPQAGRRDHLAMFVVTAGAGIRERSEQ